MLKKTFQNIIFDLEPWIVVVATIFNYILCCGLSCNHLCSFIECDIVEEVMKMFKDSPKKSSNKLLHV